MKTGILRLIDCCNKNGGTDNSFYVFVYDDGNVIEDIKNPLEAPINTRIEVIIKDNKITWWDWYEKAFAMRDDTVKDIALVKVVSVGYANENAKLAVEQAAKELEHFLIQTNDDLWEKIQVTPYLIENKERQNLGLYTFNFDSIKDRMREQHPDKVDGHNYYHGWGGSHPSYNGLAFHNSDKAWTWNSGAQRTIHHEQGHNLGCRHSSSTTYEYGHPACIMGRLMTGFCAPQLARIKQIREESIEYVENNQCYFLSPIEVPTRDLRNGEKKGLMISEIDGYKNYMLSTRKTVDQSILGIKKTEGIVYIEKVIPNFANSPIFLTQLFTGDQTEVGGYVVKNDGVHEGVVKIKIGSAPDRKYPMPIELPEGEEFETGLSGAWYDPKFSHQGLDLFVNDNHSLHGYWFTYHVKGEHGVGVSGRNNGKKFFTIIGDVVQGNNVAKVKIYSVHGRESKLEGEGTLRYNGEYMTFRFYTETYGRDSWKLYRLTNLRQQPSGIWKSGEYEGYTVGKYKVKDKDGKKKDLYVVYHYFHGAQDNVDWTVYTGYDRTALEGVSTFSRYKANFSDKVEKLDNTIDVDWVINNHVNVF